ncbi:DUF2911 domain-containing protein [Maribacter sp. PR1]|uniref:DUF2911 domain-containing protein n=1 Tax=Maribacter cobaltidurans TaxID=1178778 RepID=A0ABU7IYM7_9FLAO|nr:MULTISPECIES: DUF2911 domain-containing protein [Maribacter]MDC6390268.1 DUF2911 domain-containing protein [Maribacter sp. PR1]MEE1977658.1 DUF2911 domain-containing protein [Maribacter cobaltidurans]
MKFLKRLVIALLVLFGLFYYVGLPYLRNQTKKYSPERTSTFTLKGAELAVHYSSPSKKGRDIFGDLVPFNQVWRTGANEPTTFTTSEAIKIIDKPLSAGTYSLWTIPNKDSWKVIFNKEVPNWGVTFFGNGTQTTRDASEDIVNVEVPSRKAMEPIEEFTIDFSKNEQLYLSLSWDDTIINIPISK